MTNEAKLALMRDRVLRLDGSPKNTKCPGVLRKAKRQVRNMEKVVK